MMITKKHPTLPYTITKTGKILKLKGVGLFRKACVSTCGYEQIGYKGKTYSVHRLVWEAFNGEIPENLQINHKNGVKTDNRLENLELVTAAENMQHAVTTGLKTGDHGETNSQAKLTNDEYYIVIDRLVKGASNQEVADEFGLHPRYVSLIRHRKRLLTIWAKYESDTGIKSAKKSNGLNSKIPLNQRIDIIRRLETSMNKDLAQEINVDCSVISQVRHKKAWLDAWEIVNNSGSTASHNDVGSSESKWETSQVDGDMV